MTIVKPAADSLFNGNGNGTGSAVELTTVNTGLAMTAADFVVV